MVFQKRFLPTWIQYASNFTCMAEIKEIWSVVFKKYWKRYILDMEEQTLLYSLSSISHSVKVNFRQIDSFYLNTVSGKQMLEWEYLNSIENINI